MKTWLEEMVEEDQRKSYELWKEGKNIMGETPNLSFEEWRIMEIEIAQALSMYGPYNPYEIDDWPQSKVAKWGHRIGLSLGLIKNDKK